MAYGKRVKRKWEKMRKVALLSGSMRVTEFVTRSRERGADARVCCVIYQCVG